jgi:hypothetical protein
MRRGDRHGCGLPGEGEAVSVPEDAVLAYWREHREQLRQSENQRAARTNHVLVITAAISGFIMHRSAATAPARH